MNNWGIRQEKITDYKQICYIAKRLEPTYDEYGNMFTEYDTPQKYYMNIQPVTNTSNATVFGELTHRVKCSIVPKEIYEDKGDRSVFTDNVEKFIHGLMANKDKLPDGCKLSVSRLSRYIEKGKYE